jgi:hypothetical protein
MDEGTFLDPYRFPLGLSNNQTYFHQELCKGSVVVTSQYAAGEVDLIEQYHILGY